MANTKSTHLKSIRLPSVPGRLKRRKIAPTDLTNRLRETPAGRNDDVFPNDCNVSQNSHLDSRRWSKTFGRRFVASGIASLFSALCLVTYPPFQASAQTVSDCIDAVNSGQWQLAEEECQRTISIVNRAMWSQGGTYCDHGCAHSLAELPDQATKAEEQLVYSELAECEAIIAIHYGHLSIADYWLLQAVSNSKGIAEYPAGMDPMITALRPTAQKVFKQQVREQAYVKRRMLALAPVKPRRSASAPKRKVAMAALKGDTPSGATETRTCASPNAPASIKGTAVEPEYPDVAREAGAVGTALARVSLGANGAVTNVVIAKSAGNDNLDAATIKAASATSYIAEIVQCQPVPGTYLFQSDFTGQ